MDKAKLLKLAGEADMYAKDIELAFPKARNTISSLRWALKGIRDELVKPEAVLTVSGGVIQGSIVASGGGDLGENIEEKKRRAG